MIEDALRIPTEQPRDARPPSPILKWGLYTGIAMVAEMAIALLVINRVAALEPYALVRNAFFFAGFIILMLAPVCRFWMSPVRMFSSAMIAWIMFVAAYNLAGLYFEHLFDELHHDPFLVLVEGAGFYGICAVGSWVIEMIVHACRHSILPDRRAARAAARHAR
jgi:hypothetical protein